MCLKMNPWYFRIREEGTFHHVRTAVWRQWDRLDRLQFCLKSLMIPLPPQTRPRVSGRLSFPPHRHQAWPCDWLGLRKWEWKRHEPWPSCEQMLEEPARGLTILFSLPATVLAWLRKKLLLSVDPTGTRTWREMLTIQNMRKEESFNFPKAFLRTVETSKGRLTNGKRLLDQLKMGRFSPHGGSS